MDKNIDNFIKGFEKKAITDPKLRNIISRMSTKARLKLRGGRSSKSAFKNTALGKKLSRMWK